MMFIRSAMQAFQMPAASASVAMLVPESFLPRAAGLDQTMRGITMVTAAPLGAIAIAIMPIGYALAIDVVTAILAIVPLLIFAIPQKRVPKDERTGLWNEFRDGVHVVWNDPGLSRLYALLAVIVMVIMPSMMLLPLLVRDHFGGGPEHVALMQGIGGAGAIAGGMIVAAVVPRRFILWILLGFAVSCFTFGFAAMVPGDMFWLAVAFWAVSCVTFIMGTAPFTTLIQTTVPNELQGRVLSLQSTVMALAAPVGLAFATPLGEMIGIRWLFVAMGVAGGVVSLLGFLSPVLRRLASLAVKRPVPL